MMDSTFFITAKQSLRRDNEHGVAFVNDFIAVTSACILHVYVWAHQSLGVIVASCFLGNFMHVLTCPGELIFLKAQ